MRSRGILMRYNPPPNWPAPPAGWTPPEGWQPDPAWGPPPPGHQLWLDDDAGPKKSKPWGWIAAVVAALLVGVGIGAAGGGDTTTTTSAGGTTTVTATPAAGEPGPTVTATEQVPGPGTTKTVTAKPPKPKGTIPGDGVWLVGSDIRAATYRGGGDGCYWARLSGTGGGLGDIIANGNPSGQAIVTISRSDEAFETQNCGQWERVK